MTKKLFLLLISAACLFLIQCSKNSGESTSKPLFTDSNKKTVEPSKTDTSIYLNYLCENDIGRTPYYILKGKTETPVIIIDGGIHGDEIAGYMACDTLLKYLKVIEGKVVIIPKLNLPACNATRRGLKNDFNRVFPGNKDSDDYEYRLAYYFMNFIDSLKPEVVINHHEARTKFDSEEYRKNPDKAFGQVLITCITPSEELLKNALKNLNGKIMKPEFLYNIQYYPLQPNHSLDNIVSKLKIKSYTVETFRGFHIADRIKMHLLSDLAYFEEIGIKYEFPEINFE